jgi:hypothetical protein
VRRHVRVGVRLGEHGLGDKGDNEDVLGGCQVRLET